MLIDLPSDARETLRPLFAGFTGLHGCLDAALEGTMGRARADDARRPAVALIELDFSFLAGDAEGPAAEEAVRALDLPAFVAVSSPICEDVLRRVWGEAVGTHMRAVFQAGPWDRDRLRGFAHDLPEDYTLRRISLQDAPRFEALADSLVYNFQSLDDYVARGVGFGVEHDGRFVAGCSSFAISSRCLEFEIQTHPDFRRRGLATAAAAAMIEHCLDAGLEPCWDAHNEISAALATKLGFVRPRTYPCYEIGAS
jgi:RimJ/RimL family protein N-acetyltransferase